MINVKQLKKYVFEPVVEALGFDKTQQQKENAVMLLLYTCAQESNLGKYIHQMNGPALGIMQVEPFTFNDLMKNWINHREEVQLKLARIAYNNSHCSFNQSLPGAEHMISNLQYNVAIARCLYRRTPRAIPQAVDIEGQWSIYKKYYNSVLGAATKEQFVRAAIKTDKELNKH